MKPVDRRRDPRQQIHQRIPAPGVRQFMQQDHAAALGIPLFRSAGQDHGGREDAVIYWRPVGSV